MKEAVNTNTENKSQELINNLDNLYKLNREKFLSWGKQTISDRRKYKDQFKQATIELFSKQLKDVGLDVNFIYDSKNRKFQMNSFRH